ncbi:conserved hypothetical protein [[Clostridium] ultunense Esp]|uniref:Lipoprotein YerB n=1 Tax=[Clostridium] ultunense Esp TaxID=1288971 RepID=M1ZLK8_9FIRM|nr:DUF3048 domain-containing protein [Schnuerera ultunensis]CCQ97377.1 conserved hypothetical protein [[Clostridium] ultunense Esp]SHD77426.1 conserved exported protein of unknown function [[Clostridium] ultunense Esp]
MGKMKIAILFFILLTLLSSGCWKKDVKEVEDEIIKEGEKIEEENIAEETVPKEGIPSPLSGLYASEDKVNRRPVAIMYDNHPSARWQAGLSEAEIVYEFMVEAPYTRYMAIFLIMDPKSIGPIRSSRPYFVTTLLEYDPVYVRVGGSQEAKQDIINFKIADIDGLSSSNKVLWKNKGVNKKAPHNTYSSMEVIRKTQLEKGFRQTGDYKGFNFNEEDVELDGFSAEKILINYYKNNTTLYLYNPEEKVYYREKDGVSHRDEFNKSPIIAKNIIMQETKTRIIDKEGRLSIDLVGEGKGKYITNGKGINIKWMKKSRSSKTYFYDESGKEIVLNPGVTWIQVVNVNPDLIIQ